MRRTTTIVIALALVLAATPAIARSVQADLAEARNATARFHNVDHAEAAGYGSTLDVLGCFESAEGGMGLHFLNGSHLEDLEPSVTEPEALVYEMGDDGSLELVALEYIVPREPWDATHTEMPMLLGQMFHPHPVLPLYVLHAWIWKPNPAGMFFDWNPRVGDCPDGVPVFGVDLP
ncbi:MAG TPA: hypothetical protein VFP42_04020 [Acidimicrobiia bacterium]|nr:hypothetical protein [Acidimicrobiia bacterium]